MTKSRGKRPNNGALRRCKATKKVRLLFTDRSAAKAKAEGREVKECKECGRHHYHIV